MGSKGNTRRKTNSPPTGEENNWIWHTRKQIASPAWRHRPINCVRVLEFLEIEHLKHGGVENGNLLAPYNQLTEFGASRPFIWEAIGYAEAMGLIEVKRGGKKGTVMDEVSRYRLTYAWTRVKENNYWNWVEPTDEWMTKTEVDIDAWNARVTVHKDELQAQSKRRIDEQNRCTNITPTVHKHELPSVHKPKLDNGQAIEIAQSGEVHISEHPSISRVPTQTSPKQRGRSAPLRSAVASPREPEVANQDVARLLNTSYLNRPKLSAQRKP